MTRLSVLVYAICAPLLFMWLIIVPVLGWLVISVLGIWELIIEIVGLAAVHKTSRLVAFGTLIGVGIIAGIVAYIIVIALAVALGSLFGLGAFSSPRIMGSACVASPSFVCSGMTYSHLGYIMMTLGQSTGETWTGWGVAYAPEGTALTQTGGPDVNFTTQAGALTSGQTGQVFIPTNATSVGTATSGAVWVCYTTNGAGVSAEWATARRPEG